MAISNDQFEMIVMAFITDEEFSSSFEAFAQENCTIFTADEEHKLEWEPLTPSEYTEIYKKFQDLFDTKVSELLGKNGTSSDAFYACCKEAVEKGDTDKEEALKMILALTDYDMFVQTMRDEKVRKEGTASMV